LIIENELYSTAVVFDGFLNAMGKIKARKKKKQI
jgi:hypothetical protein